jgi:hypothetical protein
MEGAEKCVVFVVVGGESILELIEISILFCLKGGAAWKPYTLLLVIRMILFWID